MDIKNVNVNINNLYGAVRNVGNNDTQILEPLGGGRWQISQVKDLTPEQKAQNREFRNGLYDSLKGMTSDDSVIRDLRNALGLPEKANENEDKKADADMPLMARDIKKAIELVMRRVDERIDKVLTTKFPPAVQQLIREAVRENPQHTIVKAFLRAEKGSVDDLAKLCRLTFQSLKGAADPSALAYLDGFAYKVADFTDVSLVHAHDKAQYDAGKAHYDSEVKKNTSNAEAVKDKKDEKKIDEEKVVEDKNDKVDDNEDKDGEEQNNELKNDKVDDNEENVVEEKIVEVKNINAQDDNDEIIEVKNNESKDDKVDNDKLKDSKLENQEPEKVNPEPEKLDFEDFYKKLEETVGKDGQGGIDFVKALREDKGRFFGQTLSDYVEGCKSAALNKATAQTESLAALLKSLASKAKQDRTMDEWVTILFDDCEETRHDFCRAQALNYAVQTCSEEINLLNNLFNKAKTGGDKLLTQKLEAFHKDVVDLENKNGGVYSALCETFLAATKQFRDKEDKVALIRKSVTEKLRSLIKDAIKNGLAKPGRANLQNVVQLDKHNPIGQYQKNEMLLQGDSQLCYLRSIENALIAQGRALPVPDPKGTYTFKLEFSDSKKDDSVAFVRDITVSRAEIDEARSLYESGKMQNQKSGAEKFVGSKDRYSRQKDALLDLDVAINIAMAKRARVKDRLANSGVDEAKRCPLDFGKNGLTEGEFSGMLSCCDLTASNYDDAVAEFFGLTPPKNFAINYSGKPNDVVNGVAVSSTKDVIIQNFGRVHEWTNKHPKGILTLNEANRHYVTITRCYWDNDDDFGFVVRDSNNKGGKEQKVNVFKYYYDGDLANDVDVDKKCHILNVHCYDLPEDKK